MPSSPVTIEIVDSRRRRGDWLKVPYLVHADDPVWIPQLMLQEKLRVFSRANAFFSFGRACFFLAYRGSEPVGRISAQINDRYIEHYGRKVGHFGFFVCQDDEEAVAALVDAAAHWLKSQGSVEMAGPFSFSVNEECGLLVEGFDTPAAFLMNQARPHFGRLLEAAGLVKAMDTFAYRMSPKEIPPPIQRLADHARAIQGVSIRRLNKKRFDEDIQTILDIYNDAWRDNWGFIPFADAEVKAMARELKPILPAGHGRIAYVGDEAAAMLLCLPDLNDVGRDLGGRLLPFNWAKLAYRLLNNKARSARVLLLGTRKAYQTSAAGTAILALMVAELLEESKAYNLDWVEFSWVLEVNKPMNALARLGAGEPVKRYRIYQKALA